MSSGVLLAGAVGREIVVCEAVEAKSAPVVDEAGIPGASLEGACVSEAFDMKSRVGEAVGDEAIVGEALDCAEKFSVTEAAVPGASAEAFVVTRGLGDVALREGASNTREPAVGECTVSEGGVDDANINEVITGEAIGGVVEPAAAAATPEIGSLVVGCEYEELLASCGQALLATGATKAKSSLAVNGRDS